MKSKKVIILIVILLILAGIVLLISLNLPKEKISDQKNITINDQFVKAILKPEYLSGQGNTSIETEMSGLETPYNFTITSWKNSGTEFTFTDKPIIKGGNFAYGHKVLTISSNETNLLNIQRFPFLECDFFGYDKYSTFGFSINRSSTTKVSLSFGGNPTSIYYTHVNMTELLQTIEQLPNNCTYTYAP
jgi:hypothetical protein